MASTRDERVPEPEVWTARLRDFVHECVGSAAGDEAERVREAARLFAYGASAGTSGYAIDPAVIDAMLACGATESAVISMLWPEAVFMVSRGQGNSCLATVIAGPGGEEIICEGPSIALALLSAYSAALLSELEEGSQSAGVRFSAGASRLH